MHLSLVMVLAGVTAILRPPGAEWLLIVLTASLIRLTIYTVAGLAVQSQPLRAAGAFALLPFYLVWRVGTAVAALKQVGDKPWLGTARD